MRRGRLTAVSVLALMLGVLANSAQAQPLAGWSRPQVVQESLAQASAPVMVSDPRGDAAVIWVAGDGSLWIALAPAGQPFHSGEELSPDAGSTNGEMTSHFIAMDSRGDVIVAWGSSEDAYPPEDTAGCCTRVRAVMIAADGRILSRETLTPLDTTAVAVSAAIAPDGSSVAVLYDSATIEHVDGEVYGGPARLLLRSARLGRPFGPPAELGEHLGSTCCVSPFVSDASVRVAAHRVSVVYGVHPPECRTEPCPRVSRESQLTTMHESVLSLKGRVLYTRTLAPLYDPGGYEHAYDAHGDLAALWSFSETSGATTPVRELVAATLPAGGPLEVSAIRTLQTEDRLGEFTSALAVAPSGREILSWWDESHNDGIAVATGKLPGSTPRLRADLSPLPPGSEVGPMQDAIDSRGQAAIVFQSQTGPYGRPKVMAILRASDGRFARPVNLAEYGEPTLSEPEVAIGADGRGVVTWLGQFHALMARRFRVG